MSTAFERVIEALEKAGKRIEGSGRIRKAQCPAHEDRKPSLSVTDGNERVLLNCHANCDKEDVLAALGLTTADLFDKPLEKQADRTFVDVYSYTDEQGEMLFQVCRTADKQFPQRRPDMSAKSGWSWNLRDVRRVPYRLPALIQAVADGKIIYITEGEKDVHAVERAGAVATTSPGGAGKWRNEYNIFFTGADVIIVADADEPGIRHAQSVAGQLRAVTTSVRVVQAASGKDAYDHLAAGHTLDQLVPVADDAEMKPSYFRRYDMAELMRRGVPEQQVMEGLLYPAKLHSLSGPPEAGKTVMGLWLALQAMRNGHNVLVVDEEAGPMQTCRLLLALGADPDMIDRQFAYLPFPGAAWNADDIKAMDELLGDLQPYLTLWDSSAALMAVAGIDENHSGDVTRFWATVLAPVARDHHCAVLVTDHDAKNGEGSRYARGSGAKLAGVDVALKLTAMRPFTRSQDGVLSLQVTKDRLGYLHRDYRIRVTHKPLEMHFTKSSAADSAGESLTPAQSKLLSVLDSEPSTIQTLTDRVAEKYGHGLKRETVSRELNQLMNAGLADRYEQGNGRPALWTRSNPKGV